MLGAIRAFSFGKEKYEEKNKNTIRYYDRNFFIISDRFTR